MRERQTLQPGMDLVLELVAVDARPATSRARRVAALDHEVRDHAVEDHVVVVAALGEGREVLARLWGVLVVELYYYRSLYVVFVCFLYLVKFCFRRGGLGLGIFLRRNILACRYFFSLSSSSSMFLSSCVVLEAFWI